MGLLDDVLADDMKFGFLDADMMPGTETLIYTKHLSGTTRTIKAQVNRDPPAGFGSTVRPKMRITVANNSTTGILSSELDTGGDTITVAYRKSEAARALRIQRSASDDTEDSAALTLELH